jgi:sugar-specific transcriptional regulator TrmB
MEAELKKLGLREYETKVYLALLKYGKLDAKQIAAYSGVPQNRVYETIESLQKLGFVDVLLGYPKKFEAIDPKVSIPTYLGIKEHELSILKSEAQALASHLKKTEPAKPEVGIWSVTGSREEIAVRRLALFNSAKKSKKMIVSTTRPPEKEFAYKKSVKGLRQRGVDFKTIRNVDVHSEKHAEWYKYLARQGADVRTTNLPLHMKMFVIDSEIAVLESTEGPEESWYLVWTNSNPVVRLLENYFDLLWVAAERKL